MFFCKLIRRYTEEKWKRHLNACERNRLSFCGGVKVIDSFLVLFFLLPQAAKVKRRHFNCKSFTSLLVFGSRLFFSFIAKQLTDVIAAGAIVA